MADDNDPEIDIPDSEAKRQAEDLNDNAFDGLINQIKVLISMHKFEDIAVKMRSVTSTEELKDWLIAREMRETELLFNLLQYVLNLREAP